MLLAHSGFVRSRESVNGHFGGVGKVKLVNISTREQSADLLYSFQVRTVVDSQRVLMVFKTTSLNQIIQ